MSKIAPYSLFSAVTRKYVIHWTLFSILKVVHSEKWCTTYAP